MKHEDLIYNKKYPYKNFSSSSSYYDEKLNEGRMNSIRKTADKHVVKGKFVVSNDRGLHTRPSTELVRCASAFKSQVFLRYQKHAVNAKSLLGVLMLAASKGAKIGIEAEGEDAELAVESIIALAENNFYINY